MQSQQNLQPPQDVYGTGCVWKSSGRNSEGNIQANVVLLSAPKHILSWPGNSTIWARSFFPVGFFSPPFSGWGKPCTQQRLQHADRSGHCWWLPRPPPPGTLARAAPARPPSACSSSQRQPPSAHEPWHIERKGCSLSGDGVLRSRAVFRGRERKSQDSGTC